VEDIVKSTLTALLIVALATPAFAQGPSTLLRDAAHHAALTESLTPHAQTPHRSWVARHPMWTGAFMGAAFGAAWGAASCAFPTDEFGSCETYSDQAGARALGGIYLGGVSAGLGALAGFVIGKIAG
jgi:hypothetical protein